MPYQEACEEASLILVHHFLQGKSINPEEADREILALVDVEARQFGFGADITLEQLSEVAEKHYGYDTELLYDFDAEDLKRILAAGHPIIAPFAGRELGNPYFSGQGPWYHMLVITGYEGDMFITNDVGTRRGEGYRYRSDALLRAMHDWNKTNEEIGGGRRVVMIVKRKEM